MTIAQEINFGFSPSSSADFEDGLNPLAFDDDFQNDLGLDDDELDYDHSQQQQNNSSSSAPTKPKRNNNRKGPGNADKRATHNAVERARRESLNGRFSVLAESLPTMKNIKRPSKAMIVNKALDFVYDAQLRERTLVQENNELRREVDQLRARLGMPPLPPPAPLPQSKPATQPTMRKSKKVQSVKASSSLKNAQSESSVQPPQVAGDSESTPSTEGGAYPSPSVSAYSSSASGSGSAQPPLYESPHLTSAFASSLFPPPPHHHNLQQHHQQLHHSHHDSAPSPTDTLASATSPSLVHPFLSNFEVQPSHSHAPSFPNLYNPAMLQAHLNAAAQAGMIPPQALLSQTSSTSSSSSSAPLPPPPPSTYLNNPAILYAMQQQYLAQQQQQQQQMSLNSPGSVAGSSPGSSNFGGNGGSFNESTSSLWAGTPPSWNNGGGGSYQTPSAVDGISF
ncbi:hypothetical protein JCM3765_000309 [Sporobolomyces pararoseus]